MPDDAETEDAPQPESALAQDQLEYENLVRDSAASGQLLTAIEVARDGIARFGASRTLNRHLALALAQTGALEAARHALDNVLKDSAGDVETLCLIGRVYKEVWRRATNPGEAAAALRESCKFYGDAFARDETYYPGINLAFTLAATGDRAQAIEVAKKVEKQCRNIIAKAKGSALDRTLAIFGKADPPHPDTPTDVWAVATLAEAMLHQGDIDAASKYYRHAAMLFEGRWRDLASMRKQGREILDFTGQSHEWLDRCFDFPSVVVFSGHMIDAPGRSPPRFPPQREPEVRDAIRAYLAQIKAGFGYASAACGADIIFCECLFDREAKINLVLPCTVDLFKQQSVSPAGPEWERRFHHVLAHATSLTIANAAGYTLASTDSAASMALVYSDRILTGLAALQSQALDLKLKALAVWDGRPGAGVGGTATVVADWRSRQLEPCIISIGSPPVADGSDAASPEASVAPKEPAPPQQPALQYEIKAMLFAEIVNYARMAERNISNFIRVFKAPLAEIIAGLSTPPIVSESSGAAYNFVFDGLTEATRLALEWRDAVGRTPWAEHGLPADFGIRIFLHAGPVHIYHDPVLRRTNCMGIHMVRAARITHVVPSGQIYGSHEFVALCGAEKVPGVSFEYMGTLPTSQLFYNAPLHRMDRGLPGNRW